MGRSNPWMALAAGLAVMAGPGVASGQELPPDIQVDLYLVRADRQIQNQDYAGALESLDIVLALQANRGMETPVELWFRHAQVALNAGYPQTAVTSATRYLQEAGREGERYASALELLDQAMSRIDDPTARAAQPARPGAEPPRPAVRAEPPAATREPPPVPAPATPVPAPPAEPSETTGGLTILFPLVGVNAASMAFTSSGPLTVDASALTGAAGGAAVALPIGDGQLGVQIGAQWAQKGARVDMSADGVTGNADISFQNFDFSALARIVPPAAVPVPFYALVGPYVSFEADCRIVVEASEGTGRFSASDDCASADFDTQSVDFGLSGGVGFEVGAGPTRINVGLLYSYGLQDINKYTGETARHRVFNIHAGIATRF